ncbi:unnamed protein product [Paramecium octaurelia]|uniref:Uncharacterized protein n=1 Tax=Paramecium octaurelia TaxID=43137 RepID=A0A8S1Y1Y4_PAROT|nr:unnamed protein product [Paramecium octaurelia]
MQFFVISIVFAHAVSQELILFASSFTDKKLVNLEGWRLYPENPLKSGFGSLSASDDDYAGLYSLNGEPDKTYTAGMHKIYDNIPPHSFLIINVKTLISNYGQGGLGAIVIRANGAVIMNEENPLDIVNNYKKTSFQLPFISSSPSVIIEFLFSVKNIIRTLTFGFREFELYYKKCPAGCLFCQTKDLKSSDCNLWSLGHRSLADSNPLNEGWLINFQGQNIYNTEYCQDDKAINLIGLASSTQSIEKTVHLKPHYKMIIQYKLLLLGAESSMYTYFNLELNDIVVSDIKIATYTEGSKVCKFRNPISYGDYILQTSYENFHQDTILKFRTYSQGGKSYLQNFKWTIRNFEIYIKKCHQDCTDTCFGPKNTQCIRDKYPEFKNFISYFTDSLFTDTQQWQMITPNQPKSPNYCSGLSIFGGYLQLNGDYFIQRIVTFQDHKTIQISFKFYQIDNFNNDILYVVVDDQIVYQTVIESIIDLTQANPLCGIYDKYDKVLKISTDVISHTQKQSIIQIYTNQPQTSQGYWGIRDFYIKQDQNVYIQEFKSLRFQIIDWLLFPWKITQKLQVIDTCKNQNYIISNNNLGQFSKFRKIIFNIPTHKRIRIQFTIILTYTSIIENTVQINYQLDENENQKTKYLTLINDQYCETSILSKAYTFDDIITHSNENLFLVLSIDSISINWGIRDFYLSYSDL